MFQALQLKGIEIKLTWHDILVIVCSIANIWPSFGPVQVFAMVLRKRHVFNYLYTDFIHTHGSSFFFWWVRGLINLELVILYLLKLKCVNNYQVTGFVSSSKRERKPWSLLVYSYSVNNPKKCCFSYSFCFYMVT